MKLEVRARDKEHNLNKSTLQAIDKMFSKLSKFMPENGLIEVRLEHLHNKRKGKTHYVHATATIPGEPSTFHIEVVGDDFRTASDKAYGKLSKKLSRRHAKLIRQPRGESRKQSFVASFINRFRRP